MIERRISARDGLPLAARDWPGNPARTPVLCLHGVARTALDFDSLAERLAGARRVVALDWAGHGESGRADDPARYRVPALIDDLRTAMAALHLHRVVVVGTSLGAMMAMALAVLRPAALAGAVLNDAGPVLEPIDPAVAGELIGRDHGFASRDAAVTFLQRAWPPLGIAEAEWPAVAERTYKQGEDGRWHPRWDPRIVALMQGGGSMGALWGPWGALAEVPLLLVWGQESRVLSAETVQRMRRERPDMGVVSLPGIGHAPLLTDPVSSSAIDRFLDGIA